MGGRWEFWIDRGGTFTDIIARRPDGRLAVRKLLSQAPGRYQDAVLAGIRGLLGVPDGQPIPAAQIGSLLLSAYGLTGAQSRVVALVISGHSTRQIVQELHISANTVQEHVTAAFDKFGVRSRRELVAALLTGRH